MPAHILRVAWATSGAELAQISLEECVDVFDVKQKLREQHGLPTSLQCVLHDERVLGDRERLDSTIMVLHVLLLTPENDDAEFESAFHESAKYGCIPFLVRLLESSADANMLAESFDSNGLADRTAPLFFAVKSGRPEAVGLLLDAEADVNIGECRDGDFGEEAVETPLFLAARTGQVEVVRMLLEARADVEDGISDDVRSTPPLCDAACHQHTEVVRLLLQAMADPNAREEHVSYPEFVHRRPVLSVAVSQGSKEIVRLLLAARASANVQQFSQQSLKKELDTEFAVAPLYDACDRKEHSVEIVRMLLEARADTNQGKLHVCPDFPPVKTTPLDNAIQMGLVEIAGLLEAALASP